MRRLSSIEDVMRDLVQARVRFEFLMDIDNDVYDDWEWDAEEEIKVAILDHHEER